MPVKPMFPLGSVLLPGMVLPLHIFEERYRALVKDCLASDREFGVALIERGSETGGGDIRAMTATMARILQSEEFDDGRWAVISVGVRRVRVTEWLPDGTYPQADVEDWPERPSANPEQLASSYVDRVAELRRVLTLAQQLGMETSPEVELSADPGEGSFQIAVLGPFGAWDRQQLLLSPGPDERLAMLADLLADQELMLEARIADLN